MSSSIFVPAGLRGEQGGVRSLKPSARFPHPSLHPKSGSPDFGTKHVEFGKCRIRLDGEGEAGLRVAPFTPRLLTAHQFGSANTHSTEPPSGFCISGVSVASALEWLDPPPTATATYCLPLTL